VGVDGIVFVGSVDQNLYGFRLACLNPGAVVDARGPRRTVSLLESNRAVPAIVQARWAVVAHARGEGLPL
jgi:hypothetical protein